MFVIEWINANREWLFSGLGLLALTAVGDVIRRGYNRWRERQAIDLTDGRMEITYRRSPSQSDRPLSTKLPGVLLRLVYKPESVQSKVKLGLRSEAWGGVYLLGPIPHVELYFQITNLGPIDIILDRMLVEVWFGQPTFSTAFLHRYLIPAGEITDGITVRQALSDNQRGQIDAFERAGGNAGAVHIYLTAYFESKLGRFFVQQSIERPRL